MRILAILLLTSFLVAGCGSNTIQIAVTVGGTLITDGNVSIASDTCTLMKLDLQDANGTAIPAPEPNGYTLLAFIPRYDVSDTTCAGASTGLENLTWPAGSSSVSFYVKITGNTSYSSEALLTDPNNLLSFQTITPFSISLTATR